MLAVNMINLAELAINNSIIFLLRNMMTESENLLDLAKQSFVDLNYEGSFNYAQNSLRNTNNVQVYEFIIYSTPLFIILFLFLINKFYKSQKRSKKYGKGRSKKRR